MINNTLKVAVEQLGIMHRVGNEMANLHETLNIYDDKLEGLEGEKGIVGVAEWEAARGMLMAALSEAQSAAWGLEFQYEKILTEKGEKK